MTTRMKMTTAIVPAVFCLAVLTAGLHAQCTPGAMAVIVNKSNGTESLSPGQLRKLLIGDVRVWPDHKPVALISREASSNVAQCAVTTIVRLSPAEFRRYVMNAEFRGDDPLAIQNADSDAQAGKLVSAAGGGLAIVDSSSLPSLGTSVKVLKINGKSPGEPGYPL